MRRNIFGGLFLIFLGCMFILNNFGLVGWDFWQIFWDFWPLLLVALGIHLIFKNNMIIQIVVFILIFIIPFVYYFSGQNNNNYFHRGRPFPWNYETQKEVSYPLLK